MLRVLVIPIALDVKDVQGITVYPAALGLMDVIVDSLK